MARCRGRIATHALCRGLMADAQQSSSSHQVCRSCEFALEFLFRRQWRLTNHHMGTITHALLAADDADKLHGLLPPCSLLVAVPGGCALVALAASGVGAGAVLAQRPLLFEQWEAAVLTTGGASGSSVAGDATSSDGVASDAQAGPPLRAWCGALARDAGLTSFLAAPLAAAGTLVGVLLLGSSAPGVADAARCVASL